MTLEQSLNKVVESYKAQGYNVVFRPSQQDLPQFAKDFKVEILARRVDVSVLASVKKNQSALEADTNLGEQAEVTNQQPGWRYDLFVLGLADQQALDKQEVKEPSDKDLHHSLQEVEKMIKGGFDRQALITAWSVLEAAMRRRLQAEGEEVGWGTSPRTLLNELYSGGHLSVSEFRELEGLFQVRNAIVHGFNTLLVEKNAVEFLVKTAGELLKEPQETA